MAAEAETERTLHRANAPDNEIQTLNVAKSVEFRPRQRASLCDYLDQLFDIDTKPTSNVADNHDKADNILVGGDQHLKDNSDAEPVACRIACP